MPEIYLVFHLSLNYVHPFVCVHVHVCFLFVARIRRIFIYLLLFLDDVEPHQGIALWTHPVGSKPQIHDPICQNRVSSNSRELLIGVEPRMFGFTAHLKPPTTRLHS